MRALGKVHPRFGGGTMRAGWLIIATTLLSSCVWIGGGKFDEAWDADEDGWGLDEDCEPDNPLVHPFAADFRGDGCDADCGEEADDDGDDWPNDADCHDGDDTIYPCAPDTPGDGVDSDCDGNDGPRTAGCDYATNDPAFGNDTPELNEDCSEQ